MNSKRLQAVFREIIDELKRNRGFAERVAKALGEKDPIELEKRKKRRAPATLDPIKIYEESGETALRTALMELSLDQLRDVVAEYGMDRSKLVMKWTMPLRVVDHIVTMAAARTRKGNAFR